MAKKQIINPLVGFGQRSIGPYANRIGGATHARHIGLGSCFRIITAQVGLTHPEVVTVCFNVFPDETTCLTTDFSFEVASRPPPDTQVPFGVGPGNCLEYTAIYDEPGETEVNSISPDDVVTLNYAPGTCHKDGDATQECVLEEYNDYPVNNRVWGPSSFEIGLVGADIVDIVFPTTPATVGSFWEVDVNGSPRGINSSAIVGNSIQLTLVSSVIDSDVVTVSQTSTSGGAVAVGGRHCWRFYDEPVQNNVPVDPELIINGTFDTDVSGWLTNNATISWVSSYNGEVGVIFVDDAGGFTSAYQEFATEIGVVYDCSCLAYAEPTPARLFITNQSQDVNSADNIATDSTSASNVWQALSLQFTAQETISRVKLYTEGPGVAHFDNVSVKKS